MLKNGEGGGGLTLTDSSILSSVSLVAFCESDGEWMDIQISVERVGGTKRFG